jgi:uncharacterized protein (TIGR03067 family)
MEKYGLMLALASGLLVSAQAQNDAVKKETEKLKGTWLVQSTLTNGKVPDDVKGGEKFIVTEDKVSVTLRDGTVAYFSFTIDPTQKPAAMDIKLFDGPDKGQVIKGIYSVEGDKLMLCFALPGNDRPTKFSGDKGTETSLSVLKREKQ